MAEVNMDWKRAYLDLEKLYNERGRYLDEYQHDIVPKMAAAAAAAHELVDKYKESVKRLREERDKLQEELKALQKGMTE